MRTWETFEHLFQRRPDLAVERVRLADTVSAHAWLRCDDDGRYGAMLRAFDQRPCTAMALEGGTAGDEIEAIVIRRV